jgi:hypothetical protein
MTRHGGRLGLIATLLACAVSAVLFGGFASSGASAAVPKPLCALGQVSTVLKPCRVNPAFAKTACTALASRVVALVGAPVSTGANRAAPTGIACYYKIGGKPQQFYFTVFKGANSKAGYAAVLKERQDWPAKAESETMPGCYGNGSKTAVNAPKALLGVGDKAFSWDQCSDGFNDSFSEVFALKGTAFYSAGTHHWAQPTPTADQLVPFVKRIILEYR